MLEKVKVSAELFDFKGRVQEEIEAEELTRDLISKLRNTGYHYSGFITMYLKDGVTRLYFNDQMEGLITVLNNLLESLETNKEVVHA